MVTRRKNARRKRSRARRKNASYSPKINPRRRKRRRTRRNYWTNDAAGHAKAARKGWKRRRASSPSRKRRKRKNPAYGRSRRRNPVYRRRINRRRRRRNPNIMASVRRAFSRQWLMQSLTVGGGVVAGFMGMPLVYRLVPESNRTTLRPYLGIVHVLIGALMAGMLRNARMKQMGVVIAGTGVYDLLAQNISQLGLPGLPVSNILLDQAFGGGAAPALAASYPVARRPISRYAALAPSAQALAASYQAPGRQITKLGSTWASDEWTTDNPYAGIWE